MNRAILFLGSILLLFSACKKAETPATAEDDLRSGTWHLTMGKLTYKDPITRGDSTMDYTSAFTDCQKDNSLIFKDNYDGVIDLGANHCVTGEPNTKPFTWMMTNDGNHISLYDVIDFFPVNNIDATVITRSLGYLTIRYQVITANPAFGTADTVVYTNVLRKN